MGKMSIRFRSPLTFRCYLGALNLALAVVVVYHYCARTQWWRYVTASSSFWGRVKDFYFQKTMGFFSFHFFKNKWSTNDSHEKTHQAVLVVAEDLSSLSDDHASRTSDQDVEECLLDPQDRVLGDDAMEVWSVKTRDTLKSKETITHHEAHHIMRCEDERSDYKTPEQHKVYVKTFGCSHNGSDTEFMMGLLQAQGYQFTESLEEATVYLINSCTVKNPSQDSLLSLVKKMQITQKPIVVAGCVPQADRQLKGLENVSLIGTTQLHRILDVFEETLKGHRVVCLKKVGSSLLCHDVVTYNAGPVIPISSGCLGACTYCKTRYARGRLGSYTPEAIMERVKLAVDEGVQQIWITSEDVGAYGIDLSTHIANLLEKILAYLEEYQLHTGNHVMLRIGMTNPPYMAKHIESIVKALNHKNCFRFIHIPVQSGSTRILKKMVRDYTQGEFTQLVDTLIQGVSHLTIATDIICGFPGETSQDHQMTLDLIDKYKFQIVNISQFYPRPGTPAARMTRVNTQVVKQRSSEVSELFRSYQRTDFLLDSYQKVWFSEHSLEYSQTVGHTVHYIKVVVPFDASLLGKHMWVRITRASKWQVEALVLSPTLQATLSRQTSLALYTPEEKIGLAN